MQDRVPAYPGRVKLTPVDAENGIYDMVRADEPTQVGDPLSKSTFLKDETAGLFGLDEAAVPDDVLRAINSDFTRIACGEVTGSLSAGADSPNSITFPFEPKLVYVTKTGRGLYNEYSSMKFDSFLWVEGMTSDSITSSSTGCTRYYARDGKTFSWWVSNTNYYAAPVGLYVAFG